MLASKRSAEKLQVIGLAAIAGVLYLFNLGKGALVDWDEAIYAEVAKEIVSSHQWLTLYWKHEPFFEKPPLSIWIQAVLFQWFGSTEFWARFGSAFAGVAIVLLTYAIARRMAGHAAGLFAAFVLLAMQSFDFYMRFGTTDAPLCLCIYLAMYAYLRMQGGNASWFYLLCASIGAGAMIKGPAILVLPLAIGLDRLFGSKRKFALGWRQYCLGVSLGLAIVAPWHIWMVFKYGRAFLDTYVGYHMFARATQTLDGHRGGPLYYPRFLLKGAFPWSVVAIGAALKWLWRREWTHSLPWALATATLLLYSLVRTKLDWYVLPVYPALAIEVGRSIAEVGKDRRVVRYTCAAVLALGIILAFTNLLSMQGIQFANQMAQMATIAKSSRQPGPLLIIARPNSDPEIDTPTAAFYSERTPLLLEFPAETNAITDSLRTYPLLDAIIQKKALDGLSRRYEIHPVAENDLLLYAIISRSPQ